MILSLSDFKLKWIGMRPLTEIMNFYLYNVGVTLFSFGSLFKYFVFSILGGQLWSSYRRETIKGVGQTHSDIS